MRALREKNFPQIISSGEDISLRSWLEVDWFYPEGFRCEEVVDGERYFLVRGETIVLQFAKPEISAQLSFRERWLAACQEIFDHEVLAPNVYLGVRLLSLAGGEPRWFDVIPLERLNSKNPPAMAEHIVLVRRKLPQTRTLAAIVSARGDISPQRLRMLVDSLQTFHRSSQRVAALLFRQRPEQTLQSLRHEALHGLEYFLRGAANFLDPYTRMIAQEVKGYLVRFFEENLDCLHRRGLNGFLVDAHGNLTAESIFFPCERKLPEIALMDRRGKHELQRTRDVLQDVAQLSIDLEVRGYAQLARQFEEIYFRAAAESFDKTVYQGFRVAEAIAAAIRVFSKDREDQLPLVSRYLSLAFTTTFDLQRPFVLCLTGGDHSERRELSQSISEVMTAEVLAEDRSRLIAGDARSGDFYAFDRLVARTRVVLAERSPVIILRESLGVEEEQELRMLAKRMNSTFFVVRNESTYEDLLQLSWTSPKHRRRLSRYRAEKFLNGLRQDGEFGPISDDASRNHLLLQAVIPQPELVLSVLRELHRFMNAENPSGR